MTVVTAVRISSPSWADVADPRWEGVPLSEYRRGVQAHRDSLLQLVHAEVQQYFNDPNLVADDANVSFPSRDRLTGEYYIAREWYAAHVDPVWIQVSVMCHCLEKTARTRSGNRDYLGLEVWLRCDPRTWTFDIWRNTDSSSI